MMWHYYYCDIMFNFYILFSVTSGHVAVKKSASADVSACVRSLVLARYMEEMVKAAAVHPRDLLVKIMSSVQDDAERDANAALSVQHQWQQQQWQQPHMITFKAILVNMIDTSEIDLLQYEALIRLTSLELNHVGFKRRSESVGTLHICVIHFNKLCFTYHLCSMFNVFNHAHSIADKGCE